MAESKEPYTHRITLLRHGESTGNEQGLYQGRAEFDLSDRGTAQVNALADFWLDHGITFVKIISSPLARAQQTARIISETLGIPLVLNDLWQEIDNGMLAGLHLEEVARKHPFTDIMTPFDPIGKTGESNMDLYRRATMAVQELVRLPAGEYLVVSHGGFLNRVLNVILGIVPQVNFSGAHFQFGNTSYAVIKYDPARHIWMVEAFNNSPHLEPEN